MLHTKKTFHLGNTVYFECEFRNLNGELADPTDSPTYTIKNALGVQVTTGGLRKRISGVWYAVWTATLTGDYVIIFSGVMDNAENLIRKEFKVIRGGGLRAR